jgi:hypothetical protein
VLDHGLVSLFPVGVLKVVALICLAFVYFLTFLSECSFAPQILGEPDLKSPSIGGFRGLSGICVGHLWIIALSLLSAVRAGAVGASPIKSISQKTNSGLEFGDQNLILPKIKNQARKPTFMNKFLPGVVLGRNNLT